MQSDRGRRKINQIVVTFVTRVHVSGLYIPIIIAYCQTWFGMGQLRRHRI